MPVDVPADVAKAAVKEALKEWLDQQFALFGRVTAAGLFSLVLAGLVAVAVHYGTK